MAGEDPNLVIVDNYVEGVGSGRKDYGLSLDDQMKQYLSIMDKVCSEAIPSGTIHDALVAFVTDIRTLYGEKSGKLSSISNTLSDTCANFIAQVDEDDQFLY
ncbi:hypothetical protein GA0061078_1678 [Bifidobacterium bohemicum]|uniref:Uncharacterized protein n=1 Tax=Bifidobacterium bohemicum DSM 22767 TaxID=1437606 RepID=A0A086ZH88_9BIFI|nr:hypothetical protein [Bifidobacterium bohemicum]KFI45888.1 hypothetical protein BBOH_0694 [Bifidobacterium bohemicum DSM 22767]SCC16374.1 hypothetical protein GA0061078_1678 [Bifidobacterium bohemicum]